MAKMEATESRMFALQAAFTQKEHPSHSKGASCHCARRQSPLLTPSSKRRRLHHVVVSDSSDEEVLWLTAQEEIPPVTTQPSNPGLTDDLEQQMLWLLSIFPLEEQRPLAPFASIPQWAWTVFFSSPSMEDSSFPPSPSHSAAEEHPQGVLP